MKILPAIFYHNIPFLFILLCLSLAFCQNTTANESIPVMPGAKVLKQSSDKNNARLVFETDQAPSAVAEFYRGQLVKRGWPDGMVMSIQNRSGLVIQDNGRQFALKADVKNGKTHVNIVLLGNLQSNLSLKPVTKMPTLSSKNQPVTGKDIQQHQTVPNEQVNSMTLDEPHQTPVDSLLLSDQTSPLLNPDFEITDIAYWPERTRIRVKVKNNGKPFEGNLDFRLNMADPYSPWILDRNITMPVSLNTTDNEWVTLLTDFYWPSPIDYPAINAVAAADPDNLIQENDERNNHFHKTMRVNCRMNIETLSNQHLTKGKGDEFAVYGQFGERIAGRFVCAKKGDAFRKLFIREWHPSMVIVDVSDLGTGTWDLTAYCSDPATTEAYASNSKPLKIERKKIKIQITSGPLNATEMANAMAKEYEDWFEDTNTNINKLWIEDGNPGATVNSIFKRKPHTVVLEIYRQDFRIAYSEHTQFNDTTEGWGFSQHFSELGPGYYLLKCYQKDKWDIIKYAHSFMFQLQ